MGKILKQLGFSPRVRATRQGRGDRGGFEKLRRHRAALPKGKPIEIWFQPKHAESRASVNEVEALRWQSR